MLFRSVYAMGEGAESWSRKSRDIDQLREKKAKLVGRHEREAELRRESLSDVDVEEARERMEKLATISGAKTRELSSHQRKEDPSFTGQNQNCGTKGSTRYVQS